jgi:hypothetical protein
MFIHKQHLFFARRPSQITENETGIRNTLGPNS